MAIREPAGICVGATPGKSHVLREAELEIAQVKPVDVATPPVVKVSSEKVLLAPMPGATSMNTESLDAVIEVLEGVLPATSTPFPEPVLFPDGATNWLPPAMSVATPV